MTRDEIIRMAREVGLEKYHLSDPMMEYAFDFCIERFARAAYEAGAAAEREACAKVAEKMLRFYTQAVTGVPEAIRARSMK